MRIAPVMSIPFKANLDLVQEIKSELSKKLSGQMDNMNSDEFVPPTLSPPIIIKKLEIQQGEKGIKSALKTGGVATGSVAAGYGVGDIATKKSGSINKLFNDEDNNVHSHHNENTDIEHIETGGDEDDTHDFEDDDVDDGGDMDD